MPALVLKKFEVHQDPQDKEYVVVHGRQAGLFAYLLSLIGIDPTTIFRCSTERIEVSVGSFFGQTKMTIPLAAVTGIQAGYTKSKPLLFGSISFSVAGLFYFFLSSVMGGGYAFMGLLFILIGTVLAVLYVLGKQMSLYVLNGGDKVWGLDFRRSVIEGVNVDLDKVDETVALINRLVLAQHQRRRD